MPKKTKEFTQLILFWLFLFHKKKVQMYIDKYLFSPDTLADENISDSVAMPMMNKGTNISNVSYSFRVCE